MTERQFWLLDKTQKHHLIWSESAGQCLSVSSKTNRKSLLKNKFVLWCKHSNTNVDWNRKWTAVSSVKTFWFRDTQYILYIRPMIYQPNIENHFLGCLSYLWNYSRQIEPIIEAELLSWTKQAQHLHSPKLWQKCTFKVAVRQSEEEEEDTEK